MKEFVIKWLIRIVILYVCWCLLLGHNITMNLIFYGRLEGRITKTEGDK